MLVRVRQFGTMITWNPARSYGFIQPDDGLREDIFVPRRAFDQAGIEDPRRGMRLSFTIGRDNNGRRFAERIAPKPGE